MDIMKNNFQQHFHGFHRHGSVCIISDGDYPESDHTNEKYIVNSCLSSTQASGILTQLAKMYYFYKGIQKQICDVQVHPPHNNSPICH